MATTEVAEALLAHAALQEATVYGVTVPGTPLNPPPHPTAPPIAPTLLQTLLFRRVQTTTTLSGCLRGGSGEGGVWGQDPTQGVGGHYQLWGRQGCGAAP